jgi:EAL domain-containing protein (putative c-di-GMP-specific phosphodiesterase class I)
MLITNSAFTMESLRELRAFGALLSVDDFGTGYSSLSYLKQLPVNELKIDRSFVKDLPGARADVAIIKAIITLAHNLAMTVVAEGVETEPQLNLLARLTCDQYQGFLCSPAVPAGEFERLLASQAMNATPDLPQGA